MYIGTISELTNISARKIRYYEECDLLHPCKNTDGYRRYSFSDVERLIEISKKVNEGYSIKKIKEIIDRKMFWDEI